MKEIISSEETARILGVSRGYLYKLMRDGELKPVDQETILNRRARLEFARKDVEELRRRRLEAKNRDAQRLQPAS